MILKFDKDRLDGILADYSKVIGVSIALVSTELDWIASCDGAGYKYCRIIQSADNCARCRLSDKEMLQKCRDTKKPQIHICHAGLCDMAIPILANDEIIAFVILGRIRRTESFSEALPNIPWFSGDIELLRKEFSKLVFFDDEKISAIANLAVAVAAYILGDGAICPRYNAVADNAARYIEEHISEEITVPLLCRRLGVSKNSLYESFRSAFGCTVKDYIIEKRLKKAERLLCETELSVGEIAERVGFLNSTYFSRVISKKTGMSPLKYRRKKGM